MTNLDLDFLKRSSAELDCRLSCGVDHGVSRGASCVVGRGVSRRANYKMSRALTFVMVASFLAAVGFTSLSARAEVGDSAQAAEVIPPRPRPAKSSKASKKTAKASLKKKSGKANASAQSVGAKEKTGPTTKGKLSRDVVFDGSVVNGKYLASGEAVSTVENEKKLNNLIGMRADFKDRLDDQRAQLRTVSDK